MTIKTRIGAERYNNRMDKIFENAKVLNEKNDKLRAEFYQLRNDDQDFANQYSKDDYCEWLDDNNIK